MKTEFTKKYIKKHKGCYTDKQADILLEQVEGDKVYLSDIVKWNIPLKHKFWFICRKCATKQENQQIAIRVAEIVLPIYEEKYPDNKLARDIIQVAKDYINGCISKETLVEKRAAGFSAAQRIFEATGHYIIEASADAAAYALDAAGAALYAADALYAVAGADAYAAADDALSAAIHCGKPENFKNELYQYLNDLIK